MLKKLIFTLIFTISVVVSQCCATLSNDEQRERDEHKDAQSVEVTPLDARVRLFRAVNSHGEFRAILLDGKVEFEAWMFDNKSQTSPESVVALMAKYSQFWHPVNTGDKAVAAFMTTDSQYYAVFTTDFPKLGGASFGIYSRKWFIHAEEMKGHDMKPKFNGTTIDI